MTAPIFDAAESRHLELPPKPKPSPFAVGVGVVVIIFTVVYLIK